VSTDYKALCVELLKEWDNAPTPSDIIDTDVFGVIRKIRTALETKETMTDNHPITPSPELVQQWAQMTAKNDIVLGNWVYIATQAAQWGYDQAIKELEVFLEKGNDKR
jgi:hypothetical protein